jgi:acetate kinase
MVFMALSHRYVAHRYRQLRGISREETNIITLHLGKRLFGSRDSGGGFN